MTITFFGTKTTQLMDPVHGGIGALRHEIACIDHPLFQRLRYILQNDVAHYVFSGATHTRFNHSIGAMHLAGKLFRSLVEQYTGESAKDFKLTQEHTEAIYYVYCCFRLAALLHDTGHFPFSHEFEESPKIKNLLRDRDLLRDFWGNSGLANKYASEKLSSDKFHFSHEDLSLAIAYKILDSVQATSLLPVEVDDVLALMENHSHSNTNKWNVMSGLLFEVFEGRTTTHHKYSNEEIGQFTRTFFAMMISGEVDVDKMDYLLRDSYFSGAKYGIYNLDHLISTLRIGFDPRIKWVGLAILDKGVVALEDFVYSRFQIYQNMWSHKAVVRAKVLLSGAIEETLSDQKIGESIRKYVSDSKYFAVFTDQFFLERFREKSILDEKSRCNKFLTRGKLKHLDKLIDPSALTIRERTKDLEESEGAPVVHRETKIKFSKIRDRDFADIRVIAKSTAGPRELRGLENSSSFFVKFHEKLVVNLYSAKID